jgi:hypothetical protein
MSAPIISDGSNSSVSAPNLTSDRSHLKIFTFIWNTQSVRLSETLDLEESTVHRTGVLSSYRFAAEVPDFFIPLMEQIRKHDADLIVIGFQEDASPGSYFHSHFLINEMPKHGYQLVKRTKLMGVGDTTYQSLFEMDFKLRGLRLSIYAKTILAQQILGEEDTLSKDIGPTQKEYVCSYMFRNKGATCSYIRVPRVGTLAFINAHLPFSSKSLLQSALQHDPMVRTTHLMSQSISFNEIYRHLILDLKVRPDAVIYMGDFNYRVNCEHGATQISNALQERGCKELYQQIYLHFDELHTEMSKRNIYYLDEGIDNAGPLFLPTAKMSKTRELDYDRGLNGNGDLTQPYQVTNALAGTCFKTGVADQRIPSWCDRILYRTLTEHGPKMKCLCYQRFDVGQTMKRSDHAGVIGVFMI